MIERAEEAGAAAGRVAARSAAVAGAGRRGRAGDVLREIEVLAGVGYRAEVGNDLENLEEKLDPRLSGEIAEELCRSLVDQRELRVDDADDLGGQRIELVNLLQERPDELAQELAQLELDASEARRRIGRPVDRAESERAGGAGIPIRAEGRLHAGTVLAQLDAHRHDNGRRRAGVQAGEQDGREISCQLAGGDDAARIVRVLEVEAEAKVCRSIAVANAVDDWAELAAGIEITRRDGRAQPDFTRAGVYPRLNDLRGAVAVHELERAAARQPARPTRFVQRFVMGRRR